MAMKEQELPNNTTAEQALLGALLIDPDAVHRVSAIVQAGDFYQEHHGWLYAAILSLANHDTPPDFVNVCDLLERREQLQGIGGPAGIVRFMETMPNSLHAEHYARLVANYATRRRLIDAASAIARAAYDTNNGDPLSEAHKALLNIGTNGSGLRSAQAVASALYDRIEQWTANPLMPGQVRGLSTGLPSVDLLTEGLQVGDLVLMAGRPSMGKSALAFEVGRRVAEQGESVLLFSLEMPAEKIFSRWASAVSQVETRRVQRGVCPEKYENTDMANRYVGPHELASYMDAMGKAGNLRIHFEDKPALSADEIRAGALAYAQRNGGLSLVVVDHSGLMRSTGSRGENSAKTEGRKSQRMKELAKELRCPVLLVQQLNRAVEARHNKRPNLGDLRDSGEHEQNADIVLALYRDSYYTEYTPGTRKDLELEVLCLKHRDGEAGTKRVLRYERHLSRFTEWEVKT